MPTRTAIFPGSPGRAGGGISQQRGWLRGGLCKYLLAPRLLCYCHQARKAHCNSTPQRAHWVKRRQHSGTGARISEIRATTLTGKSTPHTAFRSHNTVFGLFGREPRPSETSSSDKLPPTWERIRGMKNTERKCQRGRERQRGRATERVREQNHFLGGFSPVKKRSAVQETSQVTNCPSQHLSNRLWVCATASPLLKSTAVQSQRAHQIRDRDSPTKSHCPYHAHFLFQSASTFCIVIISWI